MHVLILQVPKKFDFELIDFDPGSEKPPLDNDTKLLDDIPAESGKQEETTNTASSDASQVKEVSTEKSEKKEKKSKKEKRKREDDPVDKITVQEMEPLFQKQFPEVPSSNQNEKIYNQIAKVSPQHQKFLQRL